MLGIYFLTLFILVLGVVLVAKLVISAILFSIFLKVLVYQHLISLLYFSKCLN